MTLALLPVPLFKATDANGLPLALGKLYAFAAGTDTPQALLAADGSTPLAHPVVLDASGQAEVRLGPNAYKLNLLSALDVQQSGWPLDNVSSLTPTVLGDYSATAAQMRLTTDPGESGTESLATSLAGELERLRYALTDVKQAMDPSITYWYETPYGQGWYNVKAYGATGDGATDDTTGVLAALAAIPAAGGILYFPTGTYLLSSGLDLVDRRNIALVGASSARAYLNSQSATLRYTAASGQLLTFNGAVGVTIRGLNLSYTHASYADHLIVIGQGTGAQDASEITIEDSTLMGHTSSSMTATALLKLGDEMYGLTVQRCVFANAARGIQGSTTSVINANNITIRTNLFLATFTFAHIVLGGCMWTIEGNTFEPRTGTLGSSIGVDAIGHRGASIVGNLFTDGNSASTIWVQLTGGIVRGVAILGNEFDDVHASSTAISLGACAGATISGNYFGCDIGLVGASASDVAMTGNFHGGGSTPISTYPQGQSLLDNNASYTIGPGGSVTQSVPLLSLRAPSNGNSLEWGHANAGGHLACLGHNAGTGRPFLAFNAVADTDNSNKYETFGKMGRILECDLTGGLLIGRAVSTNTDNQSLTTDVTIDGTGVVTLANGFQQKASSVTYSASMAIDGATRSTFILLVTNNTAFTIQSPTNCPTGTIIHIIISNISGGAHGTITWGANYRLVGAAGPTIANSSSQTVTFLSAGGAGPILTEISRTAGDVPN